VAVAGACLTVAAGGDRWFEADVMNQTLSLTTLGSLGPGDRVNLEPALGAGEALGGHLVQGHVDGVARVTGAHVDGIARRLALGLPRELARYVVERGSLALDGASLTVAAASEENVEVSLIPETLERTTLGGLAAGDRVNVEVDVVARYVERLVQGFEGSDRR
jgi:riboflavin synthase